jgi:glycosyltransferase involved in cell wall biosynthesis
MKIGMIVPGGVDRSGVQRSIPILLWLIARIARVHELHVFALRQEPEPCTYPLLGATVHNIGRRPRRARALAALHAEHNRAPFAVLHAFWAVPQGVIGAAASRLLHVPMVLDLVGGDLASLPALEYGVLRSRRGAAWLRFAARNAARITTQSAFMQRRAEALGIQAERLPLGVSLQHWPQGRPRAGLQTPVRLLHVGSLNRVKDHGTLLQATRLLQDRGIDYRLDLIGLDTLDGQVQRIAAELGIAQRTTFHGYVPHAELPAHYEAADVVIVSSQHESGPVVAQEAALSGRPVVGTRVGFIADWEPLAAVAVPVAEPRALADALIELFQDDARRLRFACNSQEIARTEDADWSAERVLDLYEQVARRVRRTTSLSV